MSVRKSKGNMYDWVTHVWSPLTGCAHQCSYCYVRKYRELPEVPVLDEADFPPLGKDRIIFVGHLCDMFSDTVRHDDLRRVLGHTCGFPDNQYVFQTKNLKTLLAFADLLPPNHIVGTTVETNRASVVAALSKAPPPQERTHFLRAVQGRKFLTVEPVLDFDVSEFAAMIAGALPEFVNIGADSKGHGLPEPSREKILALVDALQMAKVPIRKKINLSRIMGEQYGEEESA